FRRKFHHRPLSLVNTHILKNFQLPCGVPFICRESTSEGISIIAPIHWLTLHFFKIFNFLVAYLLFAVNQLPKEFPSSPLFTGKHSYFKKFSTSLWRTFYLPWINFRMSFHPRPFSLVNTHILKNFQLPCGDRKSTRLNSSHVSISYAVFCLKK